MTNEQAIRALVSAARQCADIDCRSEFGSGYRNAMRYVLTTLARCPTGAAAMCGDAETVECRKKERRTGKALKIGGKGRKTRVTGGDDLQGNVERNRRK